MYELFDNINHLVEEYPLEFLLFEIQQLTSFLQQHWNASYQTLPVKIVCLLSTCLLLRDICSPREGWPPNTSCSPPSSKQTSIQCSLSSLSYYLFSLEQTLRELQDTREYIFNDFITPEVVRLLQPFLVQSHRHAHPLISIHTTTDSGSSPSSTLPDVIRSPQPLVTRLPFALHDNTPLPPLPPYSSVLPVRPPTPIPPLSITHYCSPLVTQVNPCSTCGAAADHFPGCELQTRGVWSLLGVVLRFSFHFLHFLLHMFFFLFFGQYNTGLHSLTQPCAAMCSSLVIDCT